MNSWELKTEEIKDLCELEIAHAAAKKLFQDIEKNSRIQYGERIIEEAYWQRLEKELGLPLKGE